MCIKISFYYFLLLFLRSKHNTDYFSTKESNDSFFYFNFSPLIILAKLFICSLKKAIAMPVFELT